MTLVLYAELDSKGNIQVNSTFNLDTLDLYNLNKEIENLENNYKISAITMLNQYNCFFDMNGDASLGITENLYTALPKYEQILEGIPLIYKKGVEDGSSTIQETIILYFGGKSILVSEQVYGSTSINGNWANAAFGPYTILDSIDPKIFSTLRVTGAYWGGSASGNSPGVGIDSAGTKLTLIDNVTNEEVYSFSVSGRPYDKSVNLLNLNLENPVRLQYQSWGHLSTWGDPTGQAYIKNIYLVVRDDYEG